MKVSIIIPAYNAAPFLAQAVQVAINQDYPDKEIIIVNNNSTDKTVTIAENLIREHAGQAIRLLHESRQGCCPARNCGLAAARGEWIQFLDADDKIDADKISRQIRMLSPETQWVIGAYRHHYVDGRKEDSIPHQDPWRGLVYNFAIGCTISNLYHCDALQKVGGWNNDLPDNSDPELHLRLLQAATSYQLDTHIASHYHHHEQPRVTNLKDAGRYLRKVEWIAAARAHLAKGEPAYWQDNAAFFHAALLRAIRMLATYDLASAEKAYQQYFAKGLPPLDHQLVTSLVRLYPILGFRPTEALRLTLTQVIPLPWKERIKRLFQASPG